MYIKYVKVEKPTLLKKAVSKELIEWECIQTPDDNIIFALLDEQLD